MADEYIKRRDVLIKLEIAYDMARLDQKLPISDLQHEVNLIKSADVQPVRHGHWIEEVREIRKTFRLFQTYIHCSECGKEHYLGTLPKPNFCDECGARMEQEGDME